MKRMIACGALLLAAGCGPNGLDVSALNLAGHGESSACEEFEGVVELFGVPLRTRRQMKLDADGNYVKHGKAMAWYENGEKAGEMSFKDGLPHGKTFAWYESGKKKMQGQSIDGVAAGAWTEWFENGQKKSQGEYLEGERHGPWTFWQPTGELIEVVEYRGGKKIGVVENPGDTLSR